MAKRKSQSSASSGTNYKVLRPMYSQELQRTLHRGEVVSLQEDSNIRNAVRLGYLSTTNEKPPEPSQEQEPEGEESGDPGE
jgi:hypothetical protein